MSQKLQQEKSELAQVLDRIDTLTKHSKAQIDAIPQPDNIPELTEIYEGVPLNFITHAVEEFPTLSELVDDKAATNGGEAAGEIEALRAERLEALLVEIAPLVHNAINKVALQGFADNKTPDKVETEIMQTLRERLQSLI